METRIFDAMLEMSYQLMGCELGLRFYVMLGVGIVVGALMLAWVGSLFSGSQLNTFIVFLSLIFGVAIVLLVTVVMRLYVCPYVPGNYSLYVEVGGALLAYLLLMIPLFGKLNGVNYLVSLGANTAAVITLVLFMYLAALGHDMIVQGSKNLDSRRSTRQREDRALGY